MRVIFPGQTEPSLADSEAAQLFDRVKAFFHDNSYGQVSLHVTVTPVLALAESASWYKSHPFELLDDARQAAGPAGYYPSDYDFDCGHNPGIPGLDEALVADRGAWLSTADPGIACHEFGHNFGLSHANSWVTVDGSITGSGSNREYGDLFDSMGHGGWQAYIFNAFEKHLLHWLPDDAVATFSSNAVFRVHALDSASLREGWSYALRIPGQQGPDYWIELHQRAQTPAFSNSVLLTWSPWRESEGGTQLLNCRPDRYDPSPLLAGDTFYDLDRGFEVENLGGPSGSDYADVRVTRVYYFPLSLDFRSPRAAGSGAASSEEATVATASAVLRTPESGTYFVWVQTLSGDPQATLQWISISGQRAQPAHAKGGAPWRPLTSVPADPEQSKQPKAFQLAAGDQMLEVAADATTVQAVRLLITNDPATELPPAISPIADLALAMDQSAVVPFFTAAIGPVASKLELRVSWADSNLISQVQLDGDASSGTLTVVPGAGRLGTTKVNLSAIDSHGRLANRSFSVTVAGPGQALINAAAAGSTLQLPGGILLGPVVVNKDLNIEGSGLDPSVLDGQNKGVALTVSSHCSVTVHNLTVRNGLGGGIRNLGDLRLDSSILAWNRGPGMDNRAALIMERCRIEANHATEGGGLDNWQSALVSTTCIRSNIVQSGGGGVLNRSGSTLVVQNCSVTANQALGGSGGGIANLGRLLATNLTVCLNVARSTRQDGLVVSSAGGGVFNSGRLTLRNATICRNQADGSAGGLANNGNAELANCIIAGNSSPGSVDASGRLASAGFNLIQNPAGFALTGNVTGNLVGLDPRLGALSSIDGMTDGVLLLPGSPAIGAGDCLAAPNIDQWGRPRSTAPGCDLGAVQNLYVPACLHINLQPNRRYRLEASVDLIHWTNVGVYTPNPDGVLAFSDPEAAAFSSRFYRAVLQE